MGSPLFSVDRRFQRLVRRPPRVQPEGVLRAEVTAPISSSGVLSDAVVYEDPATPTQLMHLPRFRIRSSQTTYDVHVEPTPSGRWSVRFGIEPFPAEELGDQGRTPPMAFTLSAAALTYSAPPLDKRLEASERVPDASGYTIGFDVDLPGKDEILWALASENGIRLSVSRSFTAAVPVASVPEEPVGAIEIVNGGFKLMHAVAVPLEDPAMPRIFVPIEIAEPPPVDPEPEPVRPEAVLQPEVTLQPEVFLHRRAVAPQIFTAHLAERAIFASPAAADPAGLARVRRMPLGRVRDVDVASPVLAGGGVVADLTLKPGRGRIRFDRFDRFRDLTLDPGRVIITEPVGIPQPETRYRVVPTVLDSEMVLRLTPATHPGIFSGAQAQAPAFRSVRVSFPPTGPASRSHVYFQDERRPHVFFYLPDEFALDRTDTAPFRPALVFRVEQGEEESDSRASLTFRLRPRVDPSRLEAAAVELAKLIPPPFAGEPSPSVVLERVQADAALNLNLPTGAELDAPPLDLVNGFMAEVDFPFAQFQDVFAALASVEEIGTLLRGTVDVEIGGEEGPGSSGRVFVPVDIRFSSAGGDVLTVDESVATGGGVTLTVRNSSESPVRIDDLPVRMTRGGAVVVARVEGLTLPLELAAAAEVSLVVTPTGPLEGDGELDVLVDLGRVVPLPDPRVILELTLDQRIAQMSARTITVLTTANKLAGGGDTINDVFVEFQGGLGPPCHINAAQLQTTARVPIPLVDVLLRRESGPYLFRQTVLRNSGDQRDADWRTSDASLLVVPVV